MKRRIDVTALLLLPLIAVAAWAGAAWALQRSVLFPAPPASSVSPAAARPSIETILLGPDRVESWFLPAQGVPSHAPVILFTHGNGELIDHWIDAFSAVAREGVSVLLVEYPGYGRSGGTPSEESITRAMLAAWDTLVARPDVDSDRIIAWGRSLGGGAACALASHRELAALVLESSFTGVRPLARRFGIFGPLVRDPFDNLPVVSEFDRPVLVLHGERDRIIPVEHGVALDRAARDSELVLLPCGHNDCPWQGERVLEFLRRRGLIAWAEGPNGG
ncbi:MAG: alpha/beta hydrolase [marine benthic group bacterium]|nr:alpha/beta hydrolase [Gemmatimonadota bacterium]